MNVRELLADLDVPFREAGQSPHVTSGWVGILCPWCGTGGKFGLGIHLRTFKATCWKCGPHRLGDVLAAASGRPLREILPRLPDVAPVPQDDETPAGRYDPPVGVGPLLGPHRRYLIDRGYDPDEISDVWGVRGIGLGELRYQWRLFIPVFSRRKPVSWTCRAVGPDVKKRYEEAPKSREVVPMHRVLYGADLATQAVVVVEGPTDAWRIGPGAVALFGSKWTPAQVNALARYPVRAVCLDNDPEAQRQADRLADVLAGFPGETYRVVLSGKDPDTSPPAEIAELRARFLE